MKKYLHVFKAGFLNAVEYRFDFFMEVINVFIPIIVEFYVWKSIYFNASSSVINGYTFRELILYILVASITSKCVSSGFEDSISGEIRTGGLDKYIVKPISYYSYKLYEFWGKKAMHLVIGMPILLIAYIFCAFQFNELYSFYNFLFFATAIFFSVFINYAIFYSVACVGYWTTQTWGITMAFRICINILSGGVLPLAILGKFIDGISTYLPFKYIIAFPTEILLNQLLPKEMIIGLLIQMFWCVCCYYIAKLFWRIGNKKYMSTGG